MGIALAVVSLATSGYASGRIEKISAERFYAEQDLAQRLDALNTEMDVLMARGLKLQQGSSLDLAGLVQTGSVRSEQTKQFKEDFDAYTEKLKQFDAEWSEFHGTPSPYRA